MTKIHVTARMRSSNENAWELFKRYYDEKGILYEERLPFTEIDYNSAYYVRSSKDGGTTWSDWEERYDDAKAMHGAIPNSPEGDELLDERKLTLYDPKSGCVVGIGSTFYHIRGHNVGYMAWWEKGEDNWSKHTYFQMRRPDGTLVTRLFEFEEGGKDFDPENPRDPAYFNKNRCYSVTEPRILANGDIGFTLLPSMRICCKLAGVDVNTFFPSCPDFQHGLLIGRMHWNEEKKDYDFSYSTPIMLSDLQSSRGIMEPCVEELSGGRVLVVVRGSSMQNKAWNTRISPYAPGFKWYTVSYDGGKTFPPMMPLQFDDKSVVYSPASMPHLFRSHKNGKLYWLGNIIEEPWRINGNDPRWPFQIAEVDEESCALKKDTLTVIDTVRDGQTAVELSNASLMENRDTLDLEVRMTKESFNGKLFEDGCLYSEAWEYLISFED